LEVLVVDSNTKWGRSVQKLFDSVGRIYSSLLVTCHQATSLGKALKLLKTQNFDVILTDLHLDDATGFLIIEQLSPYAIETPLIVLSDMDNWAAIIRGADLGVSDFISKRELSSESLIRIVLGAKERIKLKINLTFSKALYKGLTELLPLGMAHFNEDFSITFANETLSCYFQTPPDLLTNRSLKEFITPINGWEQLFVRIKQTKLVIEIEGIGKHLNINGKPFLLNFSRYPIFNTSQYIYQCIVWDISLHKPSVIQSNLEKSLQVIDERMNSVCNQLNSSLSAILVDCGNLQLNNTFEGSMKSIQRIEHSVLSARSVLKPFLSVSSTVPTRWEILNINRLLDSCFHNAVSMSPKTILCNLTLPRSDRAIYTEPSYLQKILLNLINNAIESIKEKGRVEMIACYKIDEDVDMPRFEWISPSKEWLVVTISDTGCGFNKRLLSRIIEPLYTTKGKTHAGIGLSETWKLVKLLGGCINFNSIETEGTQVDVYVPINEQYIHQTSNNISLTRNSSNVMQKIIIVEDDDDLRKALVELLTSSNFIVHGFSNAIDALQYFSKNYDCIDFVVTDFCMPLMDGRDFVINIRKIYPTVKVVVTTGCEEEEVCNEIESLTVDGLLLKPYSINRLKSLIESVSNY
jgi:CheY-like chemotaxis protein